MLSFVHLFETALLVLATYVIGCALGHIAHRALAQAQGAPRVLKPAGVVPPGPSAAARLAATVDAEPVPSSLPAAPLYPKRPPSLSVPRNGRGDDLRKIKGVGPKIEASLHELGVFHFDQIAVWGAAECAWVEGHLGFRGRVTRERWVEQCQTFLAQEVAPSRATVA